MRKDISANPHPNKVMKTAANAPYMIACPISIPRSPAAARGPGVGGTYTWVASRPAERLTARIARGILVFLWIAFTSGVRMTKAASENTGMDTI